MMSAPSLKTTSVSPRVTPITLIALPFSGGNSYVYRGLEAHLAPSIRLVSIDLPGHGRRLGQPLLTDIHALADDVFSQIQPYITSPYAIYGHSLGTLLGYLVTQKIVRERRPLPMHLFVSGRHGPSVTSKEDGIHLLPQNEFVAKVMAYGGIPEEVAAEKELMDLFVPIMKADFQAIAGYRYTPEPPLNLPITAMIGAEDDITLAEALKWQDVTTYLLTVHEYPGNHFFIVTHWSAIGLLISHNLLKGED